MNVSRETLQPFSRAYAKLVERGGDATVRLTGADLLSVVLPFHGGSYLLVEDDEFESIFYLLYKKLLPSFCVLTNRVFDSPVGFEGAIDRYKNSASLYIKDPGRLLLIDRSTYELGNVDVFNPSEVCVVNSKTSYDVLLSALDRAKYWRRPCVSCPGDFSVRGSVIDFFPKELSFPVRVDFSYGSAVLFQFNISSQITTQKIQSVRFIVSSAGLESVSVSSFLLDLHPLFFSSSVLSWGGGFENNFSLSACTYDSYLSGAFSSEISLELGSYGVFLNKKLFVPKWFVTKKPREAVSQSPISAFDGFGSFSVGDYLIHDDYGIGLFSGLLSGECGEDSYLQLNYADAKINVHISQIRLLSFFAGAQTSGVSLGFLSKKGLWKRKKSSVSKKIESFVLNLYNQHLSRISTTKNREIIDFELLNDFVSSFSFIDTKDQATAYKDILGDLSSPLPMDRLLCGDVGFGKTELAIRASFISVLQGSRVIVLCPTTVLCYQLLGAFKSRLSAFSVNVASVSRLNSTSEVNNSIDLFNSRGIDVLVCTHRIFNYVKSLVDVGLLIIDEEHRFGVGQKELFGETFPGVDILMMSATPIPRSLQSALSGIKTMSIISTPPINRLPIETSVEYYNINRIVDYIRFEVGRGGQVYFLHNNVVSLNKFKRAFLSRLDMVRVEIIHAKMSPKKIKGVLGSFVSKEFDVLVATSIIENGLDIPNVNTVIINNAHLFGLSQLHQIRGRVGRHHRQAFAHLMIPRSLRLNGDSRRRLKAIEENVALGSGYVLSSKDLEIRGAGSVFGYAQSGGALVGFDFYNKLIQRIVSRGSVGLCLDQVSVNLFGDSATIPSAYVGDSALRLSLYRKLSLINHLTLLVSFSVELENRFGMLPEGVSLLVKSQELRLRCFDLLILSLVLVGDLCSLVFLPSKHLGTLTVFLSGVDAFFAARNVSYKFNKYSRERLLLSFVWDNKNKDILVFISDFLNKFKNGFVN